jgi:NAD(P)-dependent dehydrogenase (short-subunit alcohol dehydrogenase family)
MTLKGKVVVVTGSTRGIGRAIAEYCAKDGAKVFITSRSKKAVDKTVKAMKKKGYKAAGFPADVSKEEDVQQILEQAIKQFKKVNVWINNAGLSSGYRLIEDIPQEEIAYVVNTNITGTLYGCRLMISYFSSHGGGVIINMTGKGGRNDPSPYLTTYACTKAAVTSLTKSLAGEAKDRPVSIHCVSPGMVATDFYKDVKVSNSLKEKAKNIPYALDAFGVEEKVVGKRVAQIAAQEPGKITGKTYNFVSKPQMFVGGMKMAWWGMTGKLK